MAEITELKNTIVSFPKIKVWFICWDDSRKNVKSYDSINPKQVLSTAWNEIDYYSDKKTWIKILRASGVSDLPEKLLEN
jgi:hypothetical protein